MPTYDYRCSACQYQFEKFHSITAKPIKKCPKCGKMSVKRLISSGAGVLFKGSGFYQTDYRSKNYKESARKESSSKDSSGCKSCSAADKCPSAKH
ncbi:MAG: zinc ribbon domain-containing protein [Candidatus Omnitrophica bacterium]|nr:zinc ribbon domain-containing protein [Candidatus Omnitrophota bacterium]MDD5671956.1 zinc ribbon domain-containing protein [Candidatus Omnitrophota bacterium]